MVRIYWIVHMLSLLLCGWKWIGHCYITHCLSGKLTLKIFAQNERNKNRAFKFWLFWHKKIVHLQFWFFLLEFWVWNLKISEFFFWYWEFEIQVKKFLFWKKISVEFLSCSGNEKVSTVGISKRLQIQKQFFQTVCEKFVSTGERNLNN